MNNQLFTLGDWRAFYALPNSDVNVTLHQLLNNLDKKDPAWISFCSKDYLEIQLKDLQSLDRSHCPLYGVPFAIKDNIDALGFVTTAACPEFAYTPQESATLVKRLQQAGAVLIGKTNLDQFATGLVGVRSPYGHVPNTFNPQFISGGSSSGSASVVARGIVPFAIGTDTAGSGRIPAGFNNIVGLKPTPGSIPMKGVLPACRTIDVFSVFALTVADAASVLSLVQGAEEEPIFNVANYKQGWFGSGDRRLKVGIPKGVQCDERVGYQSAFKTSIGKLSDLNLDAIEIDMSILNEVAKLLYDGPWVSERYSVIQGMLASNPNDIDPTVRQVIEKAINFDSKDTFNAMYKLADLKVQAKKIWDYIDVLMVPTSPTLPTLNELKIEPIKKNSELGVFTNFVNLLGWSAIAVPSEITSMGLPFGVTFVAPGGFEYALTQLAVKWQSLSSLQLGTNLRSFSHEDEATNSMPMLEPSIQIAVVGAHLKGFPLHWQLIERSCKFIKTAKTSSAYKLVALGSTVPAKPGLIRVEKDGACIELEIYEMPAFELGTFFKLIEQPLGLGPIELDDGSWIKGFICDSTALSHSKDISVYGGWRKYSETLQ